MPRSQAPGPIPYAIGDLQGCAPSLEQLVTKIPSGAPLRFVGDLVNRGPASAATLRMVRAMGARAETVLGNHDIHLLAVAAGVRNPGSSDTLDDILGSADRDELLDWLRHRPLAMTEGQFLVVHAGVLPQWSVGQTLELAAEVEQQLRGPNWRAFLADIFGNAADRWHDGLRGIARHRVVVNALTRLRFCSPEGVMDFKTKEGLDKAQAPAGFLPWFDIPDRRSGDTPIVCGHWSTLGLLMRPNLMALDTGCVWGGRLTAARMAVDLADRQVIQIECPQYCDPTA